MTPHQHLDRARAPAAATARDAAIRRMSRINRLVAGGAAVMVAGFATLAAQASSGGTSTASPATTPATVSATSSSDTSASQASSDQTTVPAAPAVTYQAPVVTSGGS
jgi:hypothetical protein